MQYLFFKFNFSRKLYYFKSSEKFEIDDEVIVDTDKGEQYAKIVKIVDSLKTDDLFISFTRLSLLRLKDLIQGVIFAKGGYLVFTEYEIYSFL